MEEHATLAPCAVDAPGLDPAELLSTDTGVRLDAPGAKDAAATVIRYRSRIDEIDRQLIELIRERIAASGKVQAARMSTGGPHLSLSRETQVIGRYRAALGRLGTDVAVLLLRLSRGTTSNDWRDRDEIRVSGA